MTTYRVGASRNLPMNDSKAWDGSAAKASIWDWAGFNGDAPDPAKARQGFLVYDADAPALKGSYHLPFAWVLDGKLTALASGLRAAASRLPQMDGLSDSIRNDARAVLDGYFSKMNDSGNKAAPSAQYRDVVFTHPAAISQRATTADLLDMARKQQALDGSVFDEHPPFFARAEITNSRLDAYYSKMQPSSLQNYAAEAEGGVSVLNSHNSRQLGFGRSLSGQYVGAQGNGVARVLSDWYTVPGLNLNGVSTDDLIVGIRAGLVRDVSIGFYGGTFVCSICGLDLYDWDCPHVPGMEYQGTDASGKPAGDKQMCVGLVEDAHLAEYSLVYDGATPGAGLLKAQQEAAAGRMRPEAIRLVEARYRTHLPHPARAWAGTGVISATCGNTTSDTVTWTVTPAGEETTRMADEQETTTRAQPAAGTEQQAPSTTPPTAAPGQPTAPQAEHLASIRAAAVEVLGETAPEGVLEAVRALAAEVGRLRHLADDGRQYRTDLVAEALVEGVRATPQGETFAEETYRGLLENPSTPLSVIKRMRDDWKKAGDRQFAGGRQSVDSSQPPKAGEPATQNGARLPVAAHRA